MSSIYLYLFYYRAHALQVNSMCTLLLNVYVFTYNTRLWDSVIISHVRATLIWCFLSPVIKIGFRIATTKRVTLNYNIHYVIRLFHDYIEFCGVWKTLANLSYWNRQMKFLIMKCIICENLLCSRFDFKMNLFLIQKKLW